MRALRSRPLPALLGLLVVGGAVGGLSLRESEEARWGREMREMVRASGGDLLRVSIEAERRGLAPKLSRWTDDGRAVGKSLALMDRDATWAFGNVHTAAGVSADPHDRVTEFWFSRATYFGGTERTVWRAADGFAVGHSERPHEGWRPHP